MKTLKRLFMMGSVALTLSACGSSGTEVASQIGEEIQSGGSCKSFSTTMTNTLVQALIDHQELPLPETLRDQLMSRLGVDRIELVEQYVNIYVTLTEDTRDELGAVDRGLLIEAIMGLEIGDETTPEKAALKQKLADQYAKVHADAADAGIPCVADPDEEDPTVPVEEEDEEEPTVPTPTPTTTTLPGPVIVKKALPLAGAERVLANAYQSCAAKRLPAMVSSSISIADGGIVITGTHSSGTGLKREYGNITTLRNSHYYIRGGTESSSCFDVGKTPLIYDYGGKPYATTSVDSTLNLFKNAGSGTSVLGIDCSGYVFSALAVSGLRVSPSKRAQASLVYGINAKMYMEPTANGLTCLAPVPSLKGDTLRDGDILASSGHVVMIGAVGADPFGVNRFTSASQCTLSNMATSHFDFEVLQSSPVKGAIGIDRMRAATYLGSTSSMRTGMLEYALAACKAKFGVTSTTKPSAARLVRHKLTSECMDRQVKMDGESCVRSCVE